jgi:hypothetical protein
MISVTKQAANLLAMIAAGAFLAGMFHNQPMGFIVGTFLSACSLYLTWKVGQKEESQ